MDPNVEVFFDDVLAHHGIKGQKWGVRRTPAQLGHKPSGSRRKKSSKVKAQIRKGRKRLSGLRKKKVTTQKVVRRKRAYELNDEELQKAVKRLQMEKQYNDLVKSLDGEVNSKKGKSAIKRFNDSVLMPALTEAGKEIIKNAVKDAARRRRT